MFLKWGEDKENITVILCPFNKLLNFPPLMLNSC